MVPSTGMRLAVCVGTTGYKNQGELHKDSFLLFQKDK
jgi:hypothetical protein